jgi:hypothetical protein
MHGITIFPAEVVGISDHGFWLQLPDEKLYLAFSDFPWFSGVSPALLQALQRPGADHLYWPALDIDLSIASIRDPAAFPLLAAAPK